MNLQFPPKIVIENVNFIIILKEIINIIAQNQIHVQNNILLLFLKKGNVLMNVKMMMNIYIHLTTVVLGNVQII